MKCSSVIDSVRTTTNTVVSTINNNNTIQKITSSTIYTTVDDVCARIDKKQEELGAAHAQAVVQFFSRLFNK